MKPRAFAYHAPTTVDQAVALLAEHGFDARPLAGGQSLVPMMNLRFSSPGVLVDLNRIGELSYVREQDGALAIGAMTRYAEVQASELVRARLPILVEATEEVGYVGVRNRGTVGGALAHADPVAEWPCLMLALDAELVAAGPAGRRTIQVADFFRGMFTTALEPGELLVEIRLPLRGDHAGWGFQEFARKTGDYALVAVAVELGVTDGLISRARISLSNMADRPVRATELESAVVGLPRDGDATSTIGSVAALLEREHPLDPSLEMRRDIASTLVKRALQQALVRARGGNDE